MISSILRSPMNLNFISGLMKSVLLLVWDRYSRIPYRAPWGPPPLSSLKLEVVDKQGYQRLPNNIPDEGFYTLNIYIFSQKQKLKHVIQQYIFEVNVFNANK
jgi:hypothetical protein